MTDIGLLGALLGGLLSLVSPCSALLLPSFFAYAFDGAGRLAARTAVFYGGLATVLVPLGAGLGAMGSLLTQYRSTVTTVSGLVIVALGVATVFGRGFTFAPAQRATGSIRISGSLSVFALGAVYGFAGFCSGPLLGSVLTIAIAGGGAAYGGVLMAVYALGMTIPLFLLALLWDRFDLGSRRWLRGREITLGRVRTHTTSLVSGLLFVAIGVLFLVTDGTANLGGAMGVDDQFSLQVTLGEWARTLSDATVLLSLVLVAFVVVAVRVVRRRNTGNTDSADTADDAVEQ
ncbi:cytochrome c biogenesis CcdA family protein [Prescottella sp. R16]|uniref:cytochrome c biogenesis CcdA family protein n=1 Tax=Prescottella sp. R16 TaxID=3064529 RepID=UPI00272E982D|nr:cytochrome c biogenesis CcdA family protein [Prescottella sp. R16]